MPNSRKPSRDPNVAATDVVRRIVGLTSPEKDPAAVSLGRKGGLKGGPARAAKMTPKQRSASARKAVKARWAKKKV